MPIILLRVTTGMVLILFIFNICFVKSCFISTSVNEGLDVGLDVDLDLDIDFADITLATA